ncbi:MAG TPA: ABC transporter ATP-binding protein [Acidimicrobiia bacterium]|nr:ABC transporter ATP-binding protein [Acidimicrobiia bacterium]
MTPPVLEFDAVDAGYREFHALFAVSFSVAPGSVTALLGPNGAGKTTVARVASALVRPTNGRVRFDGEDVTTEAPWRLTRRGLVHAPEGRGVFAGLTVEENLRLTLAPPPRRRFRPFIAVHTAMNGRKRATDEAVERALDAFPVLGQRRRQPAGTLSGGEQRMLALARVLADPPRLLVADELSLGLAPLVVDAVYEALATVRAQGTSVLLVEQHVRRAIDLADHVVVLRSGRVTYDGAPSDAAAAVEALLPLPTT